MMDKSRFDRVYEQTSIRLRRYVGNMIGWDSTVEDITQEAYLRMLTTAPKRLTDEQFKSYLFTTATNIVRDSWRRGAAAGEWMSSRQKDTAVSLDTEVVAGKIDISKVLGGLSMMQRSLLLLAYAEGYSHREIAVIAGIKEKSVKVLLYRARQRFISIYQEFNSELKERST